MSFKGKFKVAGKEYNILSVSYSLNQDTDPTGRPSSITRGGKITVTVESTDDSHHFEWMTNSFERKDGSVVFFKRDSDATLKELTFKEAYVVDYKETFDHSGENPITETFTLSAKEIGVGNGTHVNEWV